MSELSEESPQEEIPIDPAVTKDLFSKWRSPRFGSANPERMNNPVWEWLIKTKLNAYQATERLDGPDAMEAGPGWCFDRFGQTSTELPDGRIVLIAGEHEDHYDPDFYIYNDVVIQRPDGSLDIYGYPREVFPPTDFHTATLVGSRIVIIGNLGYPEDRRPGETQVLVLNLADFTIKEIGTSGPAPGWIHEHRATLAGDGNSILIERGKLYRGDVSSLIENIDDWRLHLDDLRWERLTERRWPRWEIRRKDGEMNHLFGYQQAALAAKSPEIRAAFKDVANRLKEFEVPTLEEELGKPPDLELFERLYSPPVPHEVLPPSEDEFRVYRIKINGVVARYVEEMSSIQLTVEGELPVPTLTALTNDIVEKLSKLENSPCELIKF